MNSTLTKIGNLHSLSQSPDDKILQLQDEIASLIKLCEDVLGNRINIFPGSNVGALASAIVCHVDKQKQTSFIELFIKKVHESYKNGAISDEVIEIISSYLEEIGYVDAEWYIQANEDVAASKYRAGSHYIRWGYEEKRKPNQFF
ncbi:MAG: hypothetical protein K2X00_09175 [Nitrospiraceae bacterium]|nr:hypothetical protein [Nitrospiraceae bacterium]